MTRIDLLRHGDTGQQGFRGHLDDSLTADGWTQLRAAVLDHVWDAIVASPLQRCSAFARELAEARGLPLQLDARLKEYCFGAWQGVSVQTLAAEQGEALTNFWADPAAYPPPGAESFADFEARLRAALDDIVRDYPSQRVLVITHGGPIRLLRCLIDGVGSRGMANVEVPHASLHRLSWHSSRHPECSEGPAVSCSSPALAHSARALFGPRASGSQAGLIAPHYIRDDSK